MVASFRRDNVPEPTRRAYDISAFGALDAYTEENSLSLRNGSYGYNIQLRGGVLQNTIGVGAPTYKVGESTLTLPSLVPLGDQLKSMHHFRAVGESGSRRNQYAGQEATVRTRHRKTDWFKIGKVHEGCILLCCLFNLYAEYIPQMRCG